MRAAGEICFLRYGHSIPTDCLFERRARVVSSVVCLKRTRNSRVMKSGASFPRYLYSLAFVVYFWLTVGYQVYLQLFNVSLVS